MWWETEVLGVLRDLVREVKKMSKAVDDLVVQVGAMKGVVDSANGLLAKLFALIQGALDTGDLAKVQTALDDLKAQQASLADAVAANTPPTP